MGAVRKQIKQSACISIFVLMAILMFVHHFNSGYKVKGTVEQGERKKFVFGNLLELQNLPVFYEIEEISVRSEKGEILKFAFQGNSGLKRGDRVIIIYEPSSKIALKKISEDALFGLTGLPVDEREVSTSGLEGVIKEWKIIGDNQLSVMDTKLKEED